MKISIKNKEITKTIYVNKNDNLLKVLRENNIEVNNNCGAKGKCGKCKVKVLKYNYLKTTKSDEKYLSKEELKEKIRLACMINLEDDMEIEIINNKDNIYVLTDVYDNFDNLDTNIKKHYIELKKPTLKDQRDDIKRLKESLNIDLEINIKDLQNISEILEENDYKITLATYKNKLLHIQGNDRRKYKYGVAIDLGTTTIALYLIDLNNGDIISVLSKVNNQRAYGGDVISRINYTIENKNGINELNKCIIDEINEMIDKISEDNKINKEEIYNLVVVGNTTMIHLFMKLNCKNIALAPFIPTLTETYECLSSDLDININGIVSFPPGISAYVGSDISAGILSSNICEKEKYSLLLDIGTNGEMALGNKETVFTCSTAAGPAFEGANIKYGVGGIDGAISSIDLNKNTIYKTINNKTPCGICGSGVLDISSQLLQYEIIDESGRICDLDEIKNENLSKRLKEENNMKEFVIFEDESKKISFTQKDIREVQLAKAAINAGIKVLLKKSNLTYDDIEHVYIGGGFGNFMDVESAVNIGMIPKGFKNKIKSIGNCAGKGAINYLINEKKREEIINITNKCKYIELSQSKDFQEFYIDSITFE
ncbi:ASKHA domain-containing protein [Terrisporobacter mayombei]|uniref:Na(+)-translocating NADH-quinone reductase subunit F n=1 Tax=Terrisporobacter mayombei TaxID=1541 RepID=A0ABY9PYH6_9FIRM|nr:ASKHA domain-containing protein [Terrisporobacter mayombei]MCC3868611.1 ASKHA domain-containing protein [Terrisporobacter mayombei]WMT80768.1 Na(+)-translocating NADH-quinone reductase subunit F [Terrisporobacter mayombei]